MNDLAQRILEHWNRLKSQHGWSLIEDETTFIQDLTNQLYQQASRFDSKQITTLITAAYWDELYRAFLLNWENPTSSERQRAHRATEEIWQTALRNSYKYQDLCPPEELAQRVLVQLIIKRTEIKTPSALVAWILYEVRAIVKNICDKQTTQRKYSSVLENMTSTDTINSDTCEQALLSTDLLELIHTILSERHFKIIYKTVIEGLKPRTAAEELNIPVNQLRVEKCRALNLLRQDHRIQDWLGDSPNG